MAADATTRRKDEKGEEEGAGQQEEGAGQQEQTSADPQTAAESLSEWRTKGRPVASPQVQAAGPRAGPSSTTQLLGCDSASAYGPGSCPITDDSFR